MAEITAAMVKALRDATGLGMMDCKKALEKAGGDAEAAENALRAKGADTARKKAGRTTGEGLVAISRGEDGTSAAMIEVLCETDFCARNDEFKTMVAFLADQAAEQEAGAIEETEAMQARLQETLARIGENMNYARGVKISAGKIGTYLHHNGKVGVIVGVDGDASEQVLSELCMHIAFADPMGVSQDDIPAEVVEKEKQIATQQAIDSGKPPEIAEKMVAGKIGKFLAANALLEQPFVKDDKKKVKDILGGATVSAFARFSIGAR